MHFSGEARSSLSEILAKTLLTVSEVMEDTAVEPNQVYVLPPKKNIVIKDNILKLISRKHDGLSLPVGIFFISLAKDRQSDAIGLILSGSGLDGTMGMKVIQEQEVDSTIDQLQVLLKERDSANEELSSAHEEVMSVNEELQSTIEELETINEELQSATEELITLNAELQGRNADLKKLWKPIRKWRRSSRSAAMISIARANSFPFSRMSCVIQLPPLHIVWKSQNSMASMTTRRQHKR